jgi:hypothetical protein
MREFRKGKIRRHKLFLSDDHPNTNYKFVSLYEFEGKALEQVESSMSTKNLRGLPMKSSLLYIDVDTFDENKIQKVRDALKDYVYAEYFSGRKGHHFHVPHQEITDKNLVHSHKEFIKSLGLEDIVDTSIYRESGIIRRPFTVHEQSGKLKELIHVNHEGERLSLPLVEPVFVESENESEGSDAELKYKQNLLRKVSMGGRHRHFYILWVTGQRAGIPDCEIREDIIWYNSTLPNPKKEIEVVAEIRGFG